MSAVPDGPPDNVLGGKSNRSLSFNVAMISQIFPHHWFLTFVVSDPVSKRHWPMEATYAIFDRLTDECTGDVTSAFASSGHACRIGLGSFVPEAD
jgi:hypothetical protein